MSNWNCTEEEQLKEAYVEFNVTSDPLISDENQLSKFKDHFCSKIGDDAKFTSKDIADKLLKLRKAGNLPRLRS